MLRPKKKDLDFNELWDNWHNIVYKYCLHRLRDHEKAQDCMQNTFYTLYESIDKLDIGEKIGTWLLRVAENFVLKEFRNMKKEILYFSYDDDPENQSLSYEMPYIENITEQQLLMLKDEVLSSLKKEDLRLIKMLYEENKSVEEVSAVLKISSSAVYKRKTVIKNKIILLVKKITENL